MTTCRCASKNLFRAGWMMRYGSIVPSRENLLIKKMLNSNLIKQKSFFDGQQKEHYLCNVCHTKWEMVFEQERGTLGTGIKVLTKIS